MTSRTVITLAAVACCGAIGDRAAAQEQSKETVQVDSGTAIFDATTNVSAITVHGKSDALKGQVKMQRAADALVLEQVEAWVPVKTLNTGMGLRDEHMRKTIFTTQDSKVPDVRFSAQNLKCPLTSPGQEVTCPVSGNLAIRGVERPFSIALKVRQEGSTSFKAMGEGTVKLSDYGIERPSQFGVKTEDQVKFHIAFTARQTGGVRASRGAQ